MERPPDWNELLYFGDEESLVNLGSFDNVIHQSEKFSEFEIFVSWKLLEKLTILNMDEIDTLSFLFGLLSGSLYEFHYKSGEHFFRTHELDSDFRVLTPYGEDLAQSLFRCYGNSGHNHRAFWKFFLLLRRLLKTYFPESFTSDRFANIPDAVTLGKVTIQKAWGNTGKEQFLLCFPGGFRRLSIDEQIPKRLQQLELIDSYDVRPLSKTGEDYEFLVKQYKGGPRGATNRCWFRRFSSPAGADSLLLRTRRLNPHS